MIRNKRRSKKNEPKVFSGLNSRYLVITVKTIFILLVIGALFIFASWMFFWGSFFKIGRISCLEGEFPCGAEIADQLEVMRGENIFLLKAKLEAQKIAYNNPQLKTIKIEKTLPDSLKVFIEPRMGIAVLKTSSGQEVVVDEDGYVLADQSNHENLPVIEVNSLPAMGENVLDKKILLALKLIKLLQNSFINFTKIDNKEPLMMTVFLDQNKVASFSAQKDLVDQVDSLQYILRHSRMEEKKIKAIDLRFQKPVLKIAQ